MKSNAAYSRPDRRWLYRAAKRVLRRCLLPQWNGTRSALERIIRAALRGRQTDFLRRLIRVQAFAAAMAALVIASPSDADPIELSSLAVPGNTSGFLLDGQVAGDQVGSSVSDAGDVNGEGIADVIIAATGAE